MSGNREEPQRLVSRARPTALLSAAEEVRLAKRIEQGDMAAREKMIESNLRLVMTLARSFRGRGVPFADLVQEGTVGLVHAVERFDYRRGNKFSTYAVWWIGRSLLDAVTDSQVIRIPAKASRQLAAIGRAREELARAGRLSSAAIATRTDLPEATVRSLWSAPRVTASLDDSVRPDAPTLGDLIADRDATDPAEGAIARERTSQLKEMLDKLPERHRLVLVWRYGLGEQRPRSHAEIGSSLRVSAERCRQIEREALRRLRSIAPAFSLAA